MNVSVDDVPNAIGYTQVFLNLLSKTLTRSEERINANHAELIEENRKYMITYKNLLNISVELEIVYWQIALQNRQNGSFVLKLNLENIKDKVGILSPFSEKYISETSEYVGKLLFHIGNINLEYLLGMKTEEVDIYFKHIEEIANTKDDEDKQDIYDDAIKNKRNIDKKAKKLVITSRDLDVYFPLEDENVNEQENGVIYDISEKCYPELSKFVNVDNREYEYPLWNQFMSGGCSLSEHVAALKHLRNVNQLSYFSSKFVTLPQNEMMLPLKYSKNIAHLINLPMVGVECYFYCLHSYDRLDKIDVTASTRDGSEYIKYIMKNKTELKERLDEFHCVPHYKYFGKYLNLRTIMKKVNFKKGHQKFLESYLIRPGEELFFKSVDEIVGKQLVYEKEPKRIRNVIEGVKALLEKLYKVETTLKNIDEYIAFLNRCTTEDDKKKAYKDFAKDNAKLYDCEITPEEMYSLSHQYPELLETITTFNTNEIIWNEYSVLKCFFKYLNFDAFDNDNLTKFLLEIFLNEVNEFYLKNNTPANSFEIVNSKNVGICDLISHKCLIYRKDSKSEPAEILEFRHLWRDGILKSEQIISAIESTCVPHIVAGYEKFKELWKIKALQFTDDDRKNAVFPGTEIGRSAKDMIFNLKIYFENEDEAAHHFTKHPKEKFYPPINHHDVADAFFEDTKKTIIESGNAGVEVRANGVAIFAYKHNNYFDDGKGFIINPRDATKGKTNGTVILNFDASGNVYLSTSF